MECLGDILAGFTMGRITMLLEKMESNTMLLEKMDNNIMLPEKMEIS